MQACEALALELLEKMKHASVWFKSYRAYYKLDLRLATFT